MKPRALLFGPAAAAVAVMAAALIWLFTATFPVMDVLRLDDPLETAFLDGGHEVVQSFTAPRDGLTRVDIRLESQEGASGEVRFELLEASDQSRIPAGGTPVRAGQISARGVDAGGMQRFEFDPIPDSGGKSYAVRITGSGVRAKSGADTLADGTLFVDGKPAGGDLSFAVFHSTGIMNLLDKIAPFRPFPLRNSIFFIGLFTLGAAACGWLLWMVAAGRPTGTAHHGSREQQ